jgi:hypothetical protein
LIPGKVRRTPAPAQFSTGLHPVARARFPVCRAFLIAG